MKDKIRIELIVVLGENMPRNSHSGQHTAHINHIANALFFRFGVKPGKTVERIIKRHLQFEGSPSSTAAITQFVKKLQKTVWFHRVVDNRRMSKFGEFKCGEASGLRNKYVLKHTKQAFNYFMHQEFNYLMAAFARMNFRTLKMVVAPDGVKYGPVHIRGFKGTDQYTIRVTQSRVGANTDVATITNALSEYLRLSHHLISSVYGGSDTHGVILIDSANPFISCSNSEPEEEPFQFQIPEISEAPCAEPKLSDKILELQDKLKSCTERTKSLREEQSKLQDEYLLLTKQIECLTQAQAIMKGE